MWLWNQAEDFIISFQLIFMFWLARGCSYIFIDFRFMCANIKRLICVCNVCLSSHVSACVLVLMGGVRVRGYLSENTVMYI